jgi:hypothetical protein
MSAFFWSCGVSESNTNREGGRTGGAGALPMLGIGEDMISKRREDWYHPDREPLPPLDRRLQRYDGGPGDSPFHRCVKNEFLGFNRRELPK